MAPRAIELYGAALNALTGGNMPALEHAMTGVVDLLDKWGAEIDIWAAKSGGMAGAIEKGTGYLAQFGQIIADIVVAIQNLMKAEPGVAHFVLAWVEGFAKAFAVLTGFSPLLDKVALGLHGIMLWGGLLASIFANLAVGILKPIAALLSFVAGTKSATAAIEEFEVAAGAAATPVQKLQIIAASIGAGLVSMGASIRAWTTGIGASMAEAEGVVATAAAGMRGAWEGLIAVLDVVPPIAWVAAIAAGIGYLAFQTTQATPSVKAFIDQINNTIALDSASQAIDGINNSIGQLNQKIASTNISSELQNWGGSWQHLGDDTRGVLTGMAEGVTNLIGGNKITGLREFGAAIKGIFVPGAGAATQARNDIDAYSQAISHLTSQQKTLFQVAGDTMQKNAVSFEQALGLMDLAGVKAGQSFAVARQEVQNLITGYKNLGIQGGVLGNSINAVTLQAEQQQSRVQQLAQAWTNFIGLVTSGESGFVSVVQQVTGTLNQAADAGASLSVKNGQVSTSIKNVTSAAAGAKVNIDGLSASSLSLKSSFIQSVQAGSQQLNNLMQLSAAGGQGRRGLDMVAQAGRDVIQQLLPLAARSADARTMLYALAQQASYTGANSFKSLAEWVGNTKNPMQDLENITNSLTVAAGNLAADVQNLAQAISTNLNQAMAAAILQANGGRAAFNRFANAAIKSHGDLGQMSGAARQLAHELIATMGNTAQAKAEFETFAGMLGINKSRADSLWRSVTHLSSAMRAIPNISRTITITTRLITQGTGTGIGVGIPAGVAAPHASGYLVPGYGGGDRHLALLEAGEAVVPKELTPGVAPYLKAHGVPGFAAGGFMGPARSGVAPGTGPALGVIPPIQIIVDGRKLFEVIQSRTFKYNIPNGGQVTGTLRPR